MKTKITFVEPTVKPIDKITMEFSEEEFAFLMTVLNHIGGSPTYSPRRISDRIIKDMRSALAENRLSEYALTSPFTPLINAKHDAIYFDHFKDEN